MSPTAATIARRGLAAARAALSGTTTEGGCSTLTGTGLVPGSVQAANPATKAIAVTQLTISRRIFSIFISPTLAHPASGRRMAVERTNPPIRLLPGRPAADVMTIFHECRRVRET
jgi:hypothetical protein